MAGQSTRMKVAGKFQKVKSTQRQWIGTKSQRWLVQTTVPVVMPEQMLRVAGMPTAKVCMCVCVCARF